ncbi:uncharacterized protein LOC142576296 isoform X2 [Dermacentor variabilis]|uniref:uncharacterized protein LOC142576296 isoform X2 n=1 Tax=Dermacentor variabilis TaxID=34621 RepID=UPI003F5C04FC
MNNAGIPMPGSIQSTSKEEFNRAWRRNFFSPLCMIKNAVPYLRQTKENAPYGVRVNLISPGYIKTTIIKPPTVSVEEHMEMN